MKVIQIVPRIATQSSGPSLSVPMLSRSLVESGCDVELVCLEPRPTNVLFENTRYFPVQRFPGAYRLGASTAMRDYLARQAPAVDILHTHSLWMMPNVYPGKAVRGTNCKLVVSPRGTLSEWALSRSRFRKKVLMWMGQRQMLERADCFHATSEAEYQEIRRLGFRQPVAVIPNGIELPELSESSKTLTLMIPPRTLLFLARIHPTKGVDLLLDAWSELHAAFPDWQLKIAGPLNSRYAQGLQAEIQNRRIPRVEFVGELLGEAKKQAFLDADLYVLPTHSENFGISVAEALAHGVPAIVTEGAPWSGLATKNAGWWIPLEQNSLIKALNDAMSLPAAQLSEMGSCGRQWMLRDFGWDRIGRQMTAVYFWLQGTNEKPPFVLMD
jgi:glycosyltransferase involved in cell wall biosynthesis